MLFRCLENDFRATPASNLCAPLRFLKMRKDKNAVTSRKIQFYYPLGTEEFASEREQ